MVYIKNFKDISKTEVKEVGGKGASLGEMTQAGIMVPPGFVITAETYRKFSKEGELPEELIKEILRAFDELGGVRVAVRSSAVAEDSSSTSWAGQLESYLNTNRENLISNIKGCWKSIKSERAQSYAKENSVPEEDMAVAVVIQKMVDSEVSGVMFTKNPVTGNTGEFMIEACFGLGEMLVQGMITPDNYIINIGNLEIVSKEIQNQETMLIFKDGENQEVFVPDGEKEKLTDEQLIELAKIGKRIQEHYGSPQDIEWAIEDEKIYILQSRPITT